MVSRRRFLWALSEGLLAAPLLVIAAPLVAGAQPAGKVWRIGFLFPGSAQLQAPRLALFEQGLRELGYAPGQTTLIEPRYADGHVDRLRRLAGELVRLNVDVLLVQGGATLEAKKATATIPIVFIANADPVGIGVVATLARPGGNVTGLSDYHGALVSKRLELLKEMVPSLSRVAVFTDASPELVVQVRDIHAAASALGLQILTVTVKASPRRSTAHSPQSFGSTLRPSTCSERRFSRCAGARLPTSRFDIDCRQSRRNDKGRRKDS
jgi:putative tryptophan/tyrosine transport system substrate-binding protein